LSIAIANLLLPPTGCFFERLASVITAVSQLHFLIYIRSYLRCHTGIFTAKFRYTGEYIFVSGESTLGSVCSIPIFNNFLGLNPHCRIIISAGIFDEQSGLCSPLIDSRRLTKFTGIALTAARSG
jgi:hypothetical protein